MSLTLVPKQGLINYNNSVLLKLKHVNVLIDHSNHHLISNLVPSNLRNSSSRIGQFDKVDRASLLQMAADKMISLKEVSNHRDEKSAWIVVENNVYDVTDFLEEHPGGKKILLKNCGQDATKVFHQFHNKKVLSQTAAPMMIGQVPIESNKICISLFKTADTKAIITNKEIIALNQDSSHSAGYRLWKRSSPHNAAGSLQLWKAYLSNGAFALAFLNGSPEKISYSVSLSEFFIDEGRWPIGRVWKAQDLWNSSATVIIKKVTVSKTAQMPFAQAVQEDYEVVLNDVPAHGIRILKLTEKKSLVCSFLKVTSQTIVHVVSFLYLFCVVYHTRAHVKRN
ncbi:hypothetical protein O181_053744 [Austropuccinia psidii MF-1]|uniref:Cytochrome b5 heme-binding domain-containing protein n=1 Tax=Austropuccinia psidii MF-1 TaxID=1389203 RepID=A0A9Q3HSY6_9BASI|nr:hypothetical protein [Austropuccinia psidii MF-1]